MIKLRNNECSARKYLCLVASLSKILQKQNTLLSQENLSNTLCMVFQWWTCGHNIPTQRTKILG